MNRWWYTCIYEVYTCIDSTYADICGKVGMLPCTTPPLPCATPSIFDPFCVYVVTSGLLSPILAKYDPRFVDTSGK
ncbi:hypothetical protein POVWA2_002340 [Plasmodium ovale wallikeri]|uniref:Uncharacterized protein n=1 Tax=Plasmodium ovale wallikeri TaxID=864142 RepID=A0A1A8YHT2_PLAOA|nr:hypothetical protein POVWA1_002400 [Plasmodium ovale wallikeri]SBT31108.1 hypothetical protein POVWA2_002340 [Plasmodium ovale wallikeri]